MRSVAAHCGVSVPGNVKEIIDSNGDALALVSSALTLSEGVATRAATADSKVAMVCEKQRLFTARLKARCVGSATANDSMALPLRRLARCCKILLCNN